MKAAVVHNQNDIRYEEVPKPEIKKGNVLVKVAYTGICGSDVPRVNGDACHFYPNILGHEFSGSVAEIADDVEGFEIGNKVSGIPLLPCMKCEDCNNGDYSLCKNYKFIGSSVFGSFANYVLLPAQNLVKFDDNVEFTTAAFFEPATVSMHAIKRLGIGPGLNFDETKSVAILGAGTIGIFLLQWLKIFGFSNITVFDISDSRLELADKLGAKYTINSKELDSEKIFADSPNGRGYQYVFESAGNTVTLRLAYGIASNHAKICCVGTPTSQLSFSVKEWENLNRKEFYVTGSWMSYSHPFPGNEWELAAKHFSNGQLQVDESFVYKTYKLSEIAYAFEEFKIPGQVKGKILVDCSC